MFDSDTALALYALLILAFVLAVSMLCSLEVSRRKSVVPRWLHPKRSLLWIALCGPVIAILFTGVRLLFDWIATTVGFFGIWYVDQQPWMALDAAVAFLIGALLGLPFAVLLKFMVKRNEGAFVEWFFLPLRGKFTWTGGRYPLLAFTFLGAMFVFECFTVFASENSVPLVLIGSLIPLLLLYPEQLRIFKAIESRLSSPTDVERRKRAARRTWKWVLLSITAIALLAIVVVLLRRRPPPFPNDLSTVTISLRTTGCLGTCPAFSLKIHGNGSSEYEGRYSVSEEGKKSFQLPQSTVKELVREFYKARFFSMWPYNSIINATDFPSATTAIAIRGRTKSVYDDSAAPKRLEILQRRIVDLSGIREWLYGPAPPKPAPGDSVGIFYRRVNCPRLFRCRSNRVAFGDDGHLQFEETAELGPDFLSDASLRNDSSRNISPAQVTRIVDEFFMIGFLRLQSDYGDYVDGRTYTELGIRVPHRRKLYWIDDYGDAPPELKALEKLIETTTGFDDWVKAGRNPS